MPRIVVPSAAYDRAFDQYGLGRNVYRKNPHFLVLPLLIGEHLGLTATVSIELGSVFVKLVPSESCRRRLRFLNSRSGNTGIRASTTTQQTSGSVSS
ncbi:hypothetical protein [Caballeronia sp. dw_19]|uniref:hypothetical protein n=1 Tax=Caballeronia sp. dw_19 TaxID=2719791 RepID=UPI001BD3F0BA|nr:hypothetical protein [Caballeronia sp. dw_19]